DAGATPSGRVGEPADDRPQGIHGTVYLAAGDDDGVEPVLAERLGGEDVTGRALDMPAATRRDQRRAVAARAEPFGHLEGGDRAGSVQQLESREDENGDAAAHGSFCAKVVISAKMGHP